MGLLSTTIHRHSVAPAYPQVVHHHEAPTSDQARLLRELEREALDRITARATLENSIVNARLLVWRNELTGGNTVRVCFSLNGRDVSFDYETTPQQMMDLFQPAEVRDAIARRLAEEIASHLSVQLAPSVITIRRSEP